MSNPYIELFSRAGTRGFTLAGFVARLPLAMTGLGIITMLGLQRGRYGLAGGVAATFTLTAALMAPQISRIVDRYGQRRVLPVAATISVAGILLLLICAHVRAPEWTLFAGAFVVGFMPSMSSMVRARWANLFRGRPLLQTAFAFESVLDEITFIVGPTLSVFLSVWAFPEAGLLAAAVLLAIGVIAFTVQRGTEPPAHRVAHRQRGSVLQQPGVRILILLMLSMGCIAGSVNVVSVAFADQQGRPGAASIVLSVYAVGSCIAGLVFGAWRTTIPLPRLLVYCGLGTSAATLPLLLATGVTNLAFTMLVAGVFFAPTMIVAMALAERSVPAARLTEGLTWVIAGLGVGVALGAAAAGQTVDVFGARAGFGVAIAAGVGVLGAVLYGYRWVFQRPPLVDSRA